MSKTTKIYKDTSGDRQVVADDGVILVESGGYIKLGDATTSHTLAAADPPLQMTATCAATTGNVRGGQIAATFTAAATANSIELFTAIVTSNVRTGNWCNAIFGKIDYSTAGFATGIAGAICGEIDMPAATIGAGSYAAFEAEIIVPTGAAGWGTTVPVAFLVGNASGAGVAEFRDDGYIFNFTGLGSATSHKIFQANTATAASHALRILIDGVAYYMMLTNADA